MSIQGIEPSGSPLLPDPPTPADRLDERAVPPSPGSPGSVPRVPPGVEILDTAGSEHAAIPDGEPERMRAILDRLGERYYDRRGVQIEIAQRVLSDLGSPTTQW